MGLTTGNVVLIFGIIGFAALVIVLVLYFAAHAIVGRYPFMFPVLIAGVAATFVLPIVWRGIQHQQALKLIAPLCASEYGLKVHGTVPRADARLAVSIETLRAIRPLFNRTDFVDLLVSGPNPWPEIEIHDARKRLAQSVHVVDRASVATVDEVRKKGEPSAKRLAPPQATIVLEGRIDPHANGSMAAPRVELTQLLVYAVIERATGRVLAENRVPSFAIDQQHFDCGTQAYEAALSDRAGRTHRAGPRPPLAQVYRDELLPLTAAVR